MQAPAKPMSIRGVLGRVFCCGNADGVDGMHSSSAASERTGTSIDLFKHTRRYGPDTELMVELHRLAITRKNIRELRCLRVVIHDVTDEEPQDSASTETQESIPVQWERTLLHPVFGIPLEDCIPELAPDGRIKLRAPIPLSQTVAPWQEALPANCRVLPPEHQTTQEAIAAHEALRQLRIQQMREMQEDLKKQRSALGQRRYDLPPFELVELPSGEELAKAPGQVLRITAA